MISGFFQLQLNGTKAKKKETKEKKTQRIEMKKRKGKSWLFQVGFEPTPHSPAVEQNSSSSNLSATVSYTQCMWCQ